MLEPSLNVRVLPLFPPFSSFRGFDSSTDLPPPLHTLYPQITDSLKHFGLSPLTKSLLLVHIAPSPPSSTSGADSITPPATSDTNEEVLRRMEAIVEGSLLASLEELGKAGEGGAGVDEKGLRKVCSFGSYFLPFPLYYNGSQQADAVLRYVHRSTNSTPTRPSPPSKPAQQKHSTRWTGWRPVRWRSRRRRSASA
jgi:hypothetical protein